MSRRAGPLLAATVAASLLGCAAARNAAPTPGKPPLPLTSAEPHAEPDLVGATHTVRKGDTLYRIAKAYGVDPMELLEVNDLADARALKPGMEIFVPGALRPVDVPPPPAGAAPDPEPELAAPRPKPAEAKLDWPVRGVLYSRFGIRQGARHDGIDIAAPEGTVVHAAAAGVCIYAGQQAGYGSLVILRHDALGVVTLYAHARELLVAEGEKVAAGAPVAKVGQSGRTTGPHLHFEVREGTRPRNPLFFLP